MNIVLLGSGNVATHLGRAFKMAGQTIDQVWSRDLEHAKQLADTLASQAIFDIDDINRSADLYIIAVKDSAITELAKSLDLTDKLIVHTSGSTSIDALIGVSDHIGVLYPLQTFSKNKAVDFRQIPIAIEANNPDDLAAIRAIADRISEKVTELSSAQRKALHVAAVFACNFTNHLFAVSQNLLKEENLDFDLIRPLIAETAHKVQLYDPVSVQTGPAVREDMEIINSHLEMLKDQPELQDLYKKLSQSIVNLHKHPQG
ncbi:Rossmann-like and DUF2520 domain-containing protein [Daejeonella lutea]|uniref:Predicted oxidoreductase, contains short-chain dehydrogenase (SDR) and DUF2520 domains n=1 Tax=Daejeonella lutea TaxID=572036 RepID=A0A1T5EY70_9SPHI|nr:Rossmann-like and DUF2520 domain-containing protein [Daejeonella lutea]SKB88914.1 Predicted oxidoreductase, contains short-chain dehydrogenase (SDR) and DUF2520 domains [Daejeonella lutea]